MYTHIKNVQILISLLKQYGIKHVVLSPGTRNTALSHSIESDEFFHCYSIVDERSAAFVALGIAEKLNEGVCVSCTAATATSNYLPAIREAYERGIKLIALTADRDRYTMFQMEDQCIDQIDMYHGYVKKAVHMPIVRNDRDYWYCNRVCNEALQSIDLHRDGPVQINYDMSFGVPEIAAAPIKELPVTRKIDRIVSKDINWKGLAKTVQSKKRILVVCGSDYTESSRLRKSLLSFSGNCDSVVLYDTYSNVASAEAKAFLNPGPIAQVMSEEEKRSLKPDLIISFGNVYYGTVKDFLPMFAKEVEHWEVSMDGQINDGFRCLRKLFEMRPEEFFEGLNSVCKGANTYSYYKEWMGRFNQIKCGSLPFTHFKVIQTVCASLPKNSMLHTSVLNAIRLSNYSSIDPTVENFANIGADGIDGALSTFIGQARSTKRLAFLLIGDLSLLYDANSLLLDLPKNVRIIVINNYAGAEFHRNFGREIKTVNKFIAAGHNTKICHCAPLSNAVYYSANDDESLELSMKEILKDDGNPKLLEVFTDAKTDGATLNRFWDENRHVSRTIRIKNSIKKAIGVQNVGRIKKLLKR